MLSHHSAQADILWHTKNIEETTNLLEVDPQTGLSESESVARLARYGCNVLREESRRTFLHMIVGQFADFMIMVLLVAAVISGLIGEPLDALTILSIVILNAIIGTIQEYRADKSIAALKRISAPDANVIRDGQNLIIPAQDLVPGDIAILEAGNIVPADIRLVTAINLEADESALTGESQTVSKRTQTIREEQISLGDRRNLAFRGTFITSGRGHGIIIHTGMSSELGKIASLLEETEVVKTPLQKRLASFSRHLAYAILGICVIIFVTGLLRGEELILMFLTSISLAIAAIPEALPAVVTMALAMGASKMSKHNVLIRRLPAVETLGSITYICSDKTGALTQNRMKVAHALIDGKKKSTLAPEHDNNTIDSLIGHALALSNDINLVNHRENGDPTELAMFRFAAASGYDKQGLQKIYPRIAEIPFDAERKRMSTVHHYKDAFRVFVKGAPETVLPFCRSRLHANGQVIELEFNLLQKQADELADQGYRVLAIATRKINSIPDRLAPDTLENELIFLGLVALIDPPRDEVPQAVQDCLSAGITPVMITGDHPTTARTIARQLGIIEDGGEVLSGVEMDLLTQEELVQKVNNIHVYARVTPEQKLRIVEALQRNNEFVAMTGDGVNDAPALKQADIGIAMGRKGTDVARQASDMVLLDDNFSTIVRAVRAGRRSFDNIRKFIKYTMTSNSGEIWTLFLAPFLGLPIPLLPIHILWINLVTDGLPGLAMTAEPEERGNMQRPPRPPNESIFAHGMWQHMVWVGLLIGGLSLYSQAWAIERGSENWQTVVFTVLTVSQLFHSLAVRSERNSLFTIGLASNIPLLSAVLFTLCIQIATIYIPIMNTILKTHPLTAEELIFCLLLSSMVLVAVEFEKFLVRRGILYSNLQAHKWIN